MKGKRKTGCKLRIWVECYLALKLNALRVCLIKTKVAGAGRGYRLRLDTTLCSPYGAMT